MKKMMQIYITKPFLDDFNTHKGTNLNSLGAIVLVPMAIYSNSIKDIKDIPNGANAIPNDAPMKESLIY